MARSVGDADFSQPNSGRMTDYLLGGSHNFAVDRQHADQLADRIPAIAAGARAHRSFLRRAVRYLVAAGIRQFIDIGSGIPTNGHVHEVLDRVAPDATVLYVDRDAATAAHGRAMLAGRPNAAMIRGDLDEPGRVLATPEAVRLIDCTRPVGLLLLGVLNYTTPEDLPATLVAQRYRAVLGSGSHLVVSLATPGSDPGFTWSAHGDLTPRGRDEMVALFAGSRLVRPGLVSASRWRPDGRGAPDGRAARLPGLVGVGRW